MIKKIEGIIISEVDYKETSKIVNIFSLDHGIIGVIAHGAKKVKNPFKANISKLTYGLFHINYKEKGLSSLIAVDIINNYKNIKKDLIKISYATFISELASQVYKHENNKNIYKIYIDSLTKIDEGFDAQVITNIFELKMLDYLGIRPIIDSCVNCGSTNNIVTISSYKGGYLCKNCLANEPVALSKTVKLIRMFYYVDIGKITKLDISDRVKYEINTFIDDYYDRYAGLYLKSKNFLKNLNKLGV